MREIRLLYENANIFFLLIEVTNGSNVKEGLEQKIKNRKKKKTNVYWFDVPILISTKLDGA